MPRADPARRRDYELERKYGLPEGGYAELLQAQGGGCAICGKRPRTKALALDHDHRTGRIRGLLCTGMSNCNRALGPFETNARTARRAAAYLLEIAADLERHELTKMSHAKEQQ